MSMAPALSIPKTATSPNFISHGRTLRDTSSNPLYCLLSLADKEYMVGSKFETAKSGCCFCSSGHNSDESAR